MEEVAAPSELGNLAGDRWYEERVIPVQDLRNRLE